MQRRQGETDWDLVLNQGRDGQATLPHAEAPGSIRASVACIPRVAGVANVGVRKHGRRAVHWNVRALTSDDDLTAQGACKR